MFYSDAQNKVKSTLKPFYTLSGDICHCCNEWLSPNEIILTFLTRDDKIMAGCTDYFASLVDKKFIELINLCICENVRHFHVHSGYLDINITGSVSWTSIPNINVKSTHAHTYSLDDSLIHHSFSEIT